MLLYVSMREVRRFTKDLHFAGLQATSKQQLETIKTALLEVYGLEDKEDRDKRHAAMIERMNQWTNRDPFMVEKMASTTDIREKVAAIESDRRNAEVRRRRPVFDTGGVPAHPTMPRRGKR